MDEKTDIVTNIFWGAVELALAQLNLESKEYNVRVPASSGRTFKGEQGISFMGDSIPVVIPANSGDIVKTGGGVNHLNLIQIKGRPAHSWQPRLLQDNLGMFNIFRPTMCCVEMNKILLKADETKKK